MDALTYSLCRMFEELYYFTREWLTPSHPPRTPHSASLIFDRVFCEQYVTASLVSDFRIIQAFVLHRALAGIPLHGEALDVACGPGLLLGEFAQQRPGVTFTGLDLSPAMLSLAQHYFERERITNVRLIEGDMTHLAKIFGDRRFDSITWTFGLNYCTTPQQALATLNAMADLLKPGGTFFLVDLARFKREETWRWLSEKHDRAHGERFLKETTDSYLAAFSLNEFTQLLRRSHLSGMFNEWSYFFPMLLIAHNQGSDSSSSERPLLTWRDRMKYAALRTIFRRRTAVCVHSSEVPGG